jgi:rRNA-processing protein FCF1
LQKISLVADASALVSLASVSFLSLVLSEFNVVVSDVVVRELKEISTYADTSDNAASEVLRNIY